MISKSDDDSGHTLDASPGDFSLSHSDTFSLIDAAKAGSREALGKLLDESQPYLLTVARRTISEQILRKIGEADLLQDVMVNASGGIQSFEGDNRGKFLSWLKTILVHVTTSRIREIFAQKRNAKRETLVSGSKLDANSLSQDSPSSIFRQQEDKERLAAAMGTLPQGYRQVLELNSEGASFVEISRQLGLNPDSTRSLYYRALHALSKAFDEPSPG